MEIKRKKKKNNINILLKDIAINIYEKSFFFKLKLLLCLILFINLFLYRIKNNNNSNNNTISKITETNYSNNYNNNKNASIESTIKISSRNSYLGCTTLNELIYKLKNESSLREPKYIILCDYFFSNYCEDLNAYYIFDYYLKNNISNAYYIINIKSNLYKTLKEKNKTKNLIEIDTDTQESIWPILYPYLLNSKILVQSYIFYEFHTIVNNVTFMKYLKINHGIKYFKVNLGLSEFNNLAPSKRNIIISSPYEYEMYKNITNPEKHIFKAGLARFDRFNKIIKESKTEKDCILITFTYRSFNNSIYEKSLFKKNLEKLLKDENLINFLKKKDIDLIYIQHHHDLILKRQFDEKIFPYIKKKEQKDLGHYIKQCKLYITDFSSVVFDFMFQNKPSLFYLIDVNDKLDFIEKKYMRNLNDTMYFGNAFKDKNLLIEKIKYYIERDFKIEDDLKKKYESVFFYKYNITQRIVKIIDQIIAS